MLFNTPNLFYEVYIRQSILILYHYIVRVCLCVYEGERQREMLRNRDCVEYRSCARLNMTSTAAWQTF